MTRSRCDCVARSSPCLSLSLSLTACLLLLLLLLSHFNDAQTIDALTRFHAVTQFCQALRRESSSR